MKLPLAKFAFSSKALKIMTLQPTETAKTLVIQENNSFPIENYQVEVLSYLGQYTADVYYFKVKIATTNVDIESSHLGLLRVGSVAGGLRRELELRQALGDYKMMAELLAHTTAEDVIINPHSRNLQPEDQQNHEIEQNSEPVVNTENLSTDDPDNELDKNTNYLEEEYYPEKEIISEASTSKLILLSYLPDEAKTLDTWLKTDHSLEESLFITGQVCQFLRYVYQRNWCFVSIIPQLVQMGTPIQFFDLSSAYLSGEILASGLLGDYCCPELAYGKNPIHESMSSYTVGALLYHCIHQQPLPLEEIIDLKISPIPKVYQILKISLSVIPQERFPLSQLLSILVETRQEISTPKIQWNIASRSTIGLSTNRLHNEDNYGVRQQQVSYLETMLLAVVADGMGGMSQGELASKLAVKIALEEPISADFQTINQYHEWLISVFQKANESVANHVKDGGTTLSLILAIAQQLMIAHVGDSRIYLLRQGQICQLSEDHSLIAMLVASGQITEAESVDHPDRNVLTKFLGSKSRLSDGYIQDLRRTHQELSITLENEDILLLCSDGVWDLVTKQELTDIFQNHQNLQLAVDQSIKQVIKRGASDNATLVALKCCIAQYG
jgi:PPM family protein phosphatase